MKFSISRSAEGGKEVERISGFKELIGACHAAVALAKVQTGVCYYHIRAGDAHLACVSNQHPTYNTPERALADANAKLSKLRAAKKESRKRWKFLAANADSNGASDLFARIQADDVARTALFKNDFPAVLARLAELEEQVAA